MNFLGGIDSFATGMLSLAKISGAQILPIFCFHNAEGKTYVKIETPLQIESHWSRDEVFEKGMGKYVSLLEGYIRKYPEQYRNWHLLGKQKGQNHEN
jgi:predicted LPLAT superfamily acyltransferase